MEKDFTNDSLPYEKLARLGINRMNADLLPDDVKHKLMNGEVTPLLKVSIDGGNGQKVTLPLKLQMTQNDKGEIMLFAYPVRTDINLKTDDPLKLSKPEMERLQCGEVLQKSVEINGEKTLQYIQLDPETKSIMHRRVTDTQLEKKLKDMEKVNDIELGTQQKQQVREGKPVELNVGGEKVSIGIDLKEPQGFKIVNGDLKEWERQQKIRYDEQHPELLGLVMTDKNRWEYQKVVDQQSTERAIKLKTDRENNERGNSLKL